MTDEEKTKEYFNKHKYAHDNRNGKQETIHKKIYLDGLAEGRKEGKESKIGLIKFRVEQKVFELEKQNERLSKMLEIAINDTIRMGNRCFYCKDNYTKDICDNCTKENRINVMKLYRAELEKRVEKEE